MLAHVIAINNTCKITDTLIHVGDFMLDGADRHGEVEDIGLDHTRDYYIKKLFPRIVLLAGNHDDGHNCEADCKSMVLDLNQNYRNVYVNHFPSDHRYYHGPRNGWKHNAYDINLCGHVHDKWLLMWDAEKHVLNYNVGVDCHNYKPVKDSQITKDLDFIFTYHKFNQSWKMTVQNMIEWKTEIKAKINNDREKRKQKRYLKKGLTEAECLRRKEEALRKKGILK